MGIRIVIRPEDGLAMTKNTALAIMTEAVIKAARINWNEAVEDRLYTNAKQGMIVYFSPNFEKGERVSKIRNIQIDGKSYEVTAYMLPPENCGKGVVHGIDLRMKEEDIMAGFTRHAENPKVLQVRRMGKTKLLL